MILSNRRLGRLWLSILLDLLATGAWVVALPLIVIDLDAGPATLGPAMAAYLTGTLMCLGFSGHIIDSRSKSAIMGCAAAVTAAMLLVLAAATESIVHNLPVLASIVFILGCADALFGPAGEAIVPEVVEPSFLGRANSWMSIAESIAGKVIGPALAGSLVLTAGPHVLLTLLAVVSALSALLAWSLHTRPATQAGDQINTPLAGLTAGLKIIGSTRWLYLGLAWSALALLLQYGARAVALPYKFELSGHVHLYAIGIGCLGVGSLVGGLIMSRWADDVAEFRTMMLLWVGGSLPWLVIASTPNAVWIGASLFVMGTLNAAGNVCWSTLLQAKVDPGYRGRVASADWLVSISLMPISSLIAGTLAFEHGGAWMAFAALLPSLLGIVLIAAIRETETAAPTLQPADCTSNGRTT